MMVSVKGGYLAVRVRKDGRILCAAMFPKERGDIYIDDALHHILSGEVKVLVTEPHERHSVRGEWWWINNIPPNIIIDDFYFK